MAHVLICDDDESICFIHGQMLTRLGHSSDSVNSGEQALQMVLANEYDLVMLDIRMPGWSGIQTLKEIRRYKADLPVMMISAFLDQRNHVAAQAAGATLIMAKPINPYQLDAAITQILAKTEDQ